MAGAEAQACSRNNDKNPHELANAFWEGGQPLLAHCSLPARKSAEQPLGYFGVDGQVRG